MDLSRHRRAPRARLLAGACLVLAAWGHQARAQEAALDALAYTVVRTPPAEQVELPALERDRNVAVGRVRPFPERRVSDLFWYDRAGMNYGLVYQKRRAPLVVLIAGTGGSFDTVTNQLLARVLYRQGYHVLGFPSPTHPHFLVNASETGIPGRMADDARDLYRVMRMALDQVRDRIEISAIHLTGYSLGGTHAAWVAKLDEEERAIGFDRVLLLNPAVSLFNSVQILDGMYDRHVPKDPAGAQAFIDRILTRFAAVYSPGQTTSLDGEFLYQAYEEFAPGPDALQSLIGMSFRYALVNLAFTSDVLRQANYMVPADAELGATTSLTNLLKHATRHTFLEFFDGLYLPYFQARDPSLTRERAIFEAGLLPLEGWLRDNPKLGLVGSRDDIILAPGELAWVERTFGRRAALSASGGHCGNYQRADFVRAVTQFFGGEGG